MSIETQKNIIRINCECGDTTDHTIVFQRVDEDIIVHTTYNQFCGFFKRLVLAFKYLFNRQIIQHVETVISEDTKKELINSLKKL